MLGTRATTRATSTHILRPRAPPAARQSCGRDSAQPPSWGRDNRRRCRCAFPGALPCGRVAASSTALPAPTVSGYLRARGGRCGPSRRPPRCGMPPRRSDTRRHAEAAKTPASKPHGSAGVRSVCSMSKPTSVLSKADGQRAQRSDGALGVGSEHAGTAEKKRRARKRRPRKGRRASRAVRGVTPVTGPTRTTRKSRKTIRRLPLGPPPRCSPFCRCRGPASKI
jgi:hypothetical protein